MMLMAMTMSFENTSDIAAGDDDDNKNTYDISADDDNCDDNDNWDYLLYGSSPCGCNEGKYLHLILLLMRMTMTF